MPTWRWLSSGERARWPLLLPVLLLCTGTAGCGFVEDPQNYPVEGSFRGRVQIDYSALSAEPIPDDCQGSLCAPDRDCQIEVDTGGDRCQVYLQETLRLDVDLALAVPELSQLQAGPRVSALGPVIYEFDANTLGAQTTRSVLWLAPASDVAERLRVKLAEIPAAPTATPATGEVEVEAAATEALTAMLAAGETRFSLVVTTELGPLGPGEVPSPGQVELSLEVRLALLGRAISGAGAPAP